MSGFSPRFASVGAAEEAQDVAQLALRCQGSVSPAWVIFLLFDRVWSRRKNRQVLRKCGMIST